MSSWASASSIDEGRSGTCTSRTVASVHSSTRIFDWLSATRTKVSALVIEDSRGGSQRAGDGGDLGELVGHPEPVPPVVAAVEREAARLVLPELGIVDQRLDGLEQVVDLARRQVRAGQRSPDASRQVLEPDGPLLGVRAGAVGGKEHREVEALVGRTQESEITHSQQIDRGRGNW